MKIIYPKNLYSDIRIETVSITNARYTNSDLNDCKVREYTAAFLRVFDGNRWYYSSISDINSLQAELDNLSALAAPNKDILKNAIVKKMSKTKDTVLVYQDNKVSNISLDKKLALLNSLHPHLTDSKIKLYNLLYSDFYKQKEFYNSLGACIKHDSQLCGFMTSVQLSDGDKQFLSRFNKTSTSFDSLFDFESDLKTEIDESKHFMLHSSPVIPGNYTIVLAPQATGIFTHEIFGHKSEADLMLGDETSKAAWVMGKRMGADGLDIIDEGVSAGSGYAIYDDEGHKARKNYLVKNGLLSGRLHSAATAADFDEEITGNARAISYEFEPIVRMTNTYIDSGTLSFEDLIAPIKNGIYIKSVLHGSGLSTFTIAPGLAYMIENGKITKPVQISVITGSVFDTLNEIDGIGNDKKIRWSIFGGCGKSNQAPCLVAHGGPSIRVNNMSVG